jgi:hypothetical protein
MPPVSGLRKYHVDSFAGGLDVRTTPLRLATTAGADKKGDRLTIADDMRFTTEGGIAKRFGTVAVSTTMGSPIVGGIQYRKSNGDEFIVVGTRNGHLVRVNADTSWTDLLGGLTTNVDARYRFAVYNDLLHICNGYDQPMSWDGVAPIAPIASAPANGQVVVAHGNRLFMTVRASSRLYWSKLNNSLDWTGTDDAGFLEVEPNDNSILVDLVPSIQELILLKQLRPFRLQGIGPITGYTVADHLVPTTGSVGAVSTMGAQFALNNVWYVSSLGLHGLAQTQQFGDLLESFVSDKVEPYFRMHSPYSIALSRIESAVLCYDPGENVLYLTLDTNGDGENDTTLVYDLLFKGWSVWHNTPWASLFRMRNATTGAREVWAGDYTGVVRALNRPESTDVVTGKVGHITACGEPGIQKSPRYGFFYFDAELRGTVRITTRLDFGMSGGQTYIVPIQGSGSLWGSTFHWGTSSWGSRTQTIVRIDMSGLGEVIETVVENLDVTAPYTLLGYEYWFRDRRAIRRPVPA